MAADGTTGLRLNPLIACKLVPASIALRAIFWFKSGPLVSVALVPALLFEITEIMSVFL